MLDGYSRYNQISVAPEDQHKTAFITPWGMFSYNFFPFRLCKALATFQQVVLSIFSDIIHDCAEVYMNEFTIYGNTYDESL